MMHLVVAYCQLLGSGEQAECIAWMLPWERVLTGCVVLTRDLQEDEGWWELAVRYSLSKALLVTPILHHSLMVWQQDYRGRSMEIVHVLVSSVVRAVFPETHRNYHTRCYLCWNVLGCQDLCSVVEVNVEVLKAHRWTWIISKAVNHPSLLDHVTVSAFSL